MTWHEPCSTRTKFSCNDFGPRRNQKNGLRHKQLPAADLMTLLVPFSGFGEKFDTQQKGTPAVHHRRLTLTGPSWLPHRGGGYHSLRYHRRAIRARWLSVIIGLPPHHFGQ